MLLNAAVTAAPAAAAIEASPYAQPLIHVWKLPQTTALSAYWLYNKGLLSLRALRTHFYLINEWQRRLIGKKEFRYIDPDKQARSIGSNDVKRNRKNDAKRNREAVRELQAIGLCHHLEDGQWCPATEVRHLRLETDQARALDDWQASLTRRKTIITPRVLLEALPRLPASKIALNLELLTRCTWTGDKHETTAIKPISLHLRRIAKRWGISYHTIQERLNNGRLDNGNVSLGPNVQLTLDDSPPDWYLKKHGRRFFVTISKPATPSRKTRESARQLLHECALSKGVHENPTPQDQKVHENPTPLILDFSPLSIERAFKSASSPPDAAQSEGQDTGDFQSREAGEKDQDVTKGEALDALPADTVGSLPADPEPEDEDTTPAQALDMSPANTTELPPINSEPKPEPTPIACPEPAPADGPKPDRRKLIDADLRDLYRLLLIYLQFVACGALTRCDANWRHVVTAAVHALRVGKKPCAMFYRIVTEQWWADPGKWDRLSQADEEKARALIREQEPPSFMRDLRLVPKTQARSPDADFVARVQRILTLKGYKGDTFHGLKHFDEGRDWTRQRFDAALAELATPPKPAYPPPTVTLPDLPLYGSERRDMEPAAIDTGLPPPPAEPAVQVPLEAPAERENMGMSDGLPRPHEPLPGGLRVSLKYLSDEADLRHNGTLIGLFDEAAAEGRVTDDDSGLLRFFAAAEHALCVQGVVDRPALFRRIVRGKWRLITPESEARARYRLEAMTRGRQPLGGSPDGLL